MQGALQRSSLHRCAHTLTLVRGDARPAETRYNDNPPGESPVHACVYVRTLEHSRACVETAGEEEKGCGAPWGKRGALDARCGKFEYPVPGRKKRRKRKKRRARGAYKLLPLFMSLVGRPAPSPESGETARRAEPVEYATLAARVFPSG